VPSDHADAHQRIPGRSGSGSSGSRRCTRSSADGWLRSWTWLGGGDLNTHLTGVASPKSTDLLRSLPAGARGSPCRCSDLHGWRGGGLRYCPDLSR